MKPIFVMCLFLASSAAAQRVEWALETSPVLSSRPGDPAFFFDPSPAPNGTQLIVGTDTAASGLYLWAAGAAFSTALPVGLVRSADTRGSLMVVSSTTTNSILVYALVGGSVTELVTNNFNVPSPNNIALTQTRSGGFEVFVDNSSTTIQHLSLALTDGGVVFTALPALTAPEVPAGLAVDDRTGRLFVAQPSLGLMVFEPNLTSRFVSSIDAGTLGTVVGGIDLLPSADGGALIFSAAPNEREVKVHSMNGAFLASLQFGSDAGVDLGAPRFLDVFEKPVPGFPRGVLVLQDEVNGNYKLVSLAAVNAVFPLPGVATSPADAGSGDAGVSDGGPGGGAGGGGGGTSGRPSMPAPGVEPQTPSCGCSGGPFTLIPALLALWSLRRRRAFPSSP